MNISTKGRYGLRTLMDIALNQSSGPVNLQDISRRQEISSKYLWQIVNLLKTGGVLRGTRGPKGGYELMRAPDQISLLEILQLLEGPISLVECTQGDNYCSKAADCVAHDIWQEVSQAIQESLKNITLGEILRRHASTQSASHYVI